jgi:hypothetical protein
MNDYFETGLKILEYILLNFPEHPPTYIGNKADTGMIIKRKSQNKRKICEIIVYHYKDQIKIELTSYTDLYVQEIKEINFNQEELKLLKEFWQFSL